MIIHKTHTLQKLKDADLFMIDEFFLPFNWQHCRRK